MRAGTTLANHMAVPSARLQLCSPSSSRRSAQPASPRQTFVLFLSTTLPRLSLSRYERHARDVRVIQSLLISRHGARVLDNSGSLFPCAFIVTHPKQLPM